MKRYVRQALRELLDSKELTKEIILKSKNDHKRCFLKTGYNKFIFMVQKKIIPSHLKNWLLRTTGMKIGHDACIPHEICFDPYFPELIFLGKGCIVGGYSKLFSHKIEGNKLTVGKCIVASKALCGGLSTLLPGAIVSKNSILALNSELSEKMPEGELWDGRPAKLLKQLSSEEIEKFSGKGDGNYTQYYKEFRKRVKKFKKDPSQNYFKMQYNGRRENAGDDWWRARPVLRIWYNGVIVEIAARLPHCFLKTILLRMMGVKIGKRVKIGYGTYFDHLFGDLVMIEDDVKIGKHCFFDAHDYRISQTIFGKTLVKKGAVIDDYAFFACGSTIGENAMIESNSLVSRAVPPDEVWGGMPAKFIRKR